MTFFRLRTLTKLSPLPRRLLLIVVDALFLTLSVWLCFWLRLAQPFHVSFLTSGYWLLPAVILFGLPLYAFTGQYQGLTRYVGSTALYRLAGRNGLLVILLASFGAGVGERSYSCNRHDRCEKVEHLP